jgi:hypothetical protein
MRKVAVSANLITAPYRRPARLVRFFGWANGWALGHTVRRLDEWSKFWTDENDR